MDIKVKKDNSYCCVPQCTSKGGKNPELSFHRFPHVKNAFRKTLANGQRVIIKRRDEWRRLLRVGKDITPRMSVCSKHFTPNDYNVPLHGVYQKGKRHRLRPTAVPSCYLPVTKPEKVVKDKLEKSVTRECHDISSLQSDVHGKPIETSTVRNSTCSKRSNDDESKDVHDNQGIIKKMQISKETDSKNTSDSEEEINENLLETIFDWSSSPCPTDNAEEFLKKKLEMITEQYDKSWKKMKLYQRKCKLYAKQSTALKEVIDSLKQINSVPNFT